MCPALLVVNAILVQSSSFAVFCFALFFIHFSYIFLYNENPSPAGESHATMKGINGFETFIRTFKYIVMFIDFMNCNKKQQQINSMVKVTHSMSHINIPRFKVFRGGR